VFLAGQSCAYAFASCNPSSHTDIDGRYDPAAFGKSLEASVTRAEEALYLEDRNTGTSVVNAGIATAATVAKGFLSILQVGTGAARGVEDIKRGMSKDGDGWDIAIGASRILSDAGEVASASLGVAGTTSKLAKTGQIAMINRELKVVQAERNAAGLSQKAAKDLSEKMGELSAKKEFLAAGYESAGNLKRVADNGGKVVQGVDQGYRGMKVFRGKEVVVEVKGLARPPARANQMRALDTDTAGLVEGSGAWNLDRLQTAADSGRWNARGMMSRLDGAVPESFLSITRAKTGQTVISQLSGMNGRPLATPLAGLPSVSPVGEMVGAAVLDDVFRAWWQ
jgi:hypothetical protein